MPKPHANLLESQVILEPRTATKLENRPPRELNSLSFITPHLRSTTGGVYSICNYVEFLSKFMSVHLLTLKPRNEDCLSIAAKHVKNLSAESVPSSDALIINADSVHCEALANIRPKYGFKILYFQGYGTPNNEVVINNLQRKWGVIVSAKWLADEAKLHGSSNVAYVPYGIDRHIFFPPLDTKRDKIRISMMTHPVDWKGMSDGIRALEIVLQHYHEVELFFFGTKKPTLPSTFTFIDKPSRHEVAEILRSSNIFVCSSWEEGFGMPGLEAQSCGAALVTTDTKGSRDYAVHEKSALVSEPKNPNALAHNIIKLLHNPDLMLKITAGGIEQAATFPSWEESATLFAKAVQSCIKRGGNV